MNEKQSQLPSRADIERWAKREEKAGRVNNANVMRCMLLDLDNAKALADTPPRLQPELPDSEYPQVPADRWGVPEPKLQELVEYISGLDAATLDRLGGFPVVTDSTDPLLQGGKGDAFTHAIIALNKASDDAKHLRDDPPILRDCEHGNLARSCQICELTAERDQWRESCIHAKRQRDRAIRKVDELLERGPYDSFWHPDQEGPYT